MKTSLCLTFFFCVAASLRAEDAPVHLTLRQAEQIALTQHPRISVANLTALAAREVVKQAKAPFLPNIYGSLTGVGTADPNDTRLAAGALNNPLIYERQADGITVNQLITDFGRTAELGKSAQLRARAGQMNLEATREQILLEVRNAYFSSLAAQGVLKVARETVQSRKAVQEQTQLMATNKLKSELDVSFATVDFYQASILLTRAESSIKASFAVLAALMAERKPVTFMLEDVPLPANITNDTSALIMEALGQRPELARLRYESEAAKEFVKAQGKLLYPSVSLVGTAGLVPAGASQLPFDYAAAGVNVNIPIFTGGLYTARRREAEYNARAADETLRDAEDTIIRDLQVTKYNLEYAHDQLALTQQLLQNANQALELARARFQNGISSIIELTQAELNQTQAQIAETNARYDYQIQYAELEFQLGRLR